eukprot:3447703-Lingulodinium_polyedra.AAC.1
MLNTFSAVWRRRRSNGGSETGVSQIGFGKLSCVKSTTRNTYFSSKVNKTTPRGNTSGERRR